jgi:hypothetical protein
MPDLVELARGLTGLVALRLGGLALLVVCAVAAPWPAGIHVLSAQGGKAEPLRIRFLRGRDNTTVRGTLRGDAQKEYVVRARKDQRLTIRLSATPPDSLSARARGTGGFDVRLDLDARRTSSVVLPEDGDYQIWIKRETRSPGRSQYTLTVTLR